MKSSIGKAVRRLVSTGPGVIVLVVAIGVGVAYSATDGGPRGDAKHGGKPPAPPQLSDTQRQQLDGFRACIEGQGIQRPKRGSAPTAADLAKLRAAQDACIDQFPSDLPYGFMMPPPGGPGGPGHHPPGPPPGGGPGGPQSNPSNG
ncbi:MAG: hypothetical protein ACXWW8_03655 [Solirubrobacterales bacterium]